MPPRPAPPPPRPPAAAPGGLPAWLPPTVLVAAGLAAYSNSFHGPLIYDDLASIADNPSIRHLWPLTGPLSPPHGGGWTVEGRPILNLSLACNYALGGAAVGGYHVLNLLIHLAAGLTLFGLLRRILQQLQAGDQPARAIAFVSALLWILHPLQTEAVTYVIQRAESLMGLFYLGALYAFVRSCAGPRLPWAALSVAATLLAMGTKEVAVTLPVMILLLDRTCFAGSFRAAWRARGPYYLALAATWCFQALLIAGAGGNRSGSVGFGAGLSWGQYVLTQFPALARYLALAVWPHRLVFDYGPFLTTLPAALPAAALVAALGLGTLWALARAPRLGFLGFWFFGILAVTSLVPGTSEMIVERRMYLPLAAITTALAWALFRWLGRAGLGVLAGAAFLLGVLTWHRNQAYASERAIWEDSVAHYPANSRGQYNLGVAYASEGRTADEIDRYRTALRLDSHNVEALHSLANAEFHQGRPGVAVDLFLRALALRPADPRTHYDYGTVLHATGRLPEAITEFETSLRLNPAQAEAQDNLGVALAESGRLAEACTHFAAALALNPGLLRAHVNLGGALAEQDRLPEAIRQYEEALQLDPAFLGAQVNLGNVLSRAGRFREAIPHYEDALRAVPADPVLHRNLGVALEAAGRGPEAQAQFEVADQLARGGPGK